MYIFKSERDTNNPYDITTVTHEVDATTLSELLDAFKKFLLASGFQVNGEIVIEAENE